MASTKGLTIRIEEELHKELKLKCVADNVSLTEYITRLIEEDLKRAK